MGKSKIERLIGAGGIGGLALLLLMIFACPSLGDVGAITSSEFTANDVYDNEASARATAETGQTTQVWVKPSLSIALAGTMNIDVTNEFAKSVTDLSVATNSEAGLKVMINSTATTDLVEITDSQRRIATLAQAAKPADFPGVGWGYYVDAAEPDLNSFYQPVSTTATVAKDITTPKMNGTLKLGVGVKVDSATNVGLYKNTLVVSVLANPMAITSLTSLKRMQDMTPEICENTPNYVSASNYSHKTLLDDRGTTKKSYEVAKLADGNCWMTQNLALDLGFEMTANDTDLAPGRKVTLPATTTAISSGSNDNNGRISWRSSYWYYQWRTATADSGTTTAVTTAGQEAPDSICPRGWQLPLAGTLQNGTNTDSVSGSFATLLKAYSITNYSTMLSIGEKAPLSFVRVGCTYYNGSPQVGNDGGNWSRIASGSDSAYQLYWTGSSISTATKQGRALGFPVRCIARKTMR